MQIVTGEAPTWIGIKGMPVFGAVQRFVHQRTKTIITITAAALTAALLLSLQAAAASASGPGPSVTAWPIGPQSSLPGVVGVVAKSGSALTGGSLVINNGATLSGCTVNSTDYYCNVSGLKWNSTYNITGWVSDGTGTAPVSWSFQPSQNARPNLSIDSMVAFWGSYDDYTQRQLTVTSTLRNSSPNGAYNVTITGSSASSGVTLKTRLPLVVGNIAPNSTANQTYKFVVPVGIASFRQLINASAQDINGNTYSYQPSQTVNPNGKIGISVGDNFANLSDQDLDSSMADIASLGIGWVRLEMAWDLAQPNGPGSYNWPQFDRIVAAANRHNLQLVPILAYTPAWARPAGCTSWQCGPADPNQFATFAAAAASHYASMGIHTWEIWNEPNINAFWLPTPNAAAYTRLLQASYTAIKTVDPQARVISGGLSPADNTTGHIAPRDFLTAMYQDGARNYMDAVGDHPYSFPALPSSLLSWSGWSQMSDLDPSIRSIMVANGDGNKQVWATEFGCPTNGPSWQGDELLQAAMVKDAIQQVSTKPWVAGLFLYSYKDLGTSTSTIQNFFGLVRHDGSKKPAYYELRNDLLGR